MRWIKERKWPFHFGLNEAAAQHIRERVNSVLGEGWSSETQHDPRTMKLAALESRRTYVCRKRGERNVVIQSAYHGFKKWEEG